MRTLLFLVLLSGCSSEAAIQPAAVVDTGAPCDLDAEIAKLTAETKDCGHARAKSAFGGMGDTSSVTACGKAALAGGISFRARYELPGFDSLLGNVIFRGESDQLLTWDEDPTHGVTRVELFSCTSIDTVVDAYGNSFVHCVGAVKKSVLCENGKAR